MKKGVSLISLIITIIVIIILATITIFNSLDTVDDSNIAVKEKEFEDVCAYVTNVSTKALGDLINLELTTETLATTNDIGKLFVYDKKTDFSSGDTHKIENMNFLVTSGNRDPKYGYHFITGKEIENGIDGDEVSSKLENVKNDYIINFYYGVVIAKISEDKVNVFGAIR